MNNCIKLSELKEIRDGVVKLDECAFNKALSLGRALDVDVFWCELGDSSDYSEGIADRIATTIDSFRNDGYALLNAIKVIALEEFEVGDLYVTSAYAPFGLTSDKDAIAERILENFTDIIEALEYEDRLIMDISMEEFRMISNEKSENEEIASIDVLLDM